MSRWLALTAVLLSACVPARRQVDGDIVRSIHFEGNGTAYSGHNDYQLSENLVQGDSPWGVLLFPLMYLFTPEPLRPEVLLSDGYRLETWYAHHGWFDARFLGWYQRRIRAQGAHRAGVVDLVGLVDPGAQSLVRSLEIEGLDRNLRQVQGVVERTGPVVVGDPFSLDLARQASDLLHDKLVEHSRAYATVDLHVDAHPEDQAVDITLSAVPGISTRFGEVTIKGAPNVPEWLIAETLEFDKGDSYKLSDIDKSRQDLFGMGVFSVVSIEPDLSDPTREDVPVTVALTESAPRRVRAGVGIEYDSATLTPYVLGAFNHENVGKRVIKLDTELKVGFAFTPGLASSGSNGWSTAQPVFDGTIGSRVPRFLIPRLNLSGEVRVQQDVQAGLYAFLNPQVSLGLTYQASPYVTLSTGPSWELYQFLLGSDSAEAADAALLLFGDTYTSYQLATWDLALTWDSRDDPIYTKRGFYYTLGLRQSIPLPESVRQLGTDRFDIAPAFNFTELRGDARMFRPLRTKTTRDIRWVYAGRIGGKIQQSWSEAGVPYPELGFLGGASNLRGFRVNQVGAYRTVCVDATASGRTQVRYLPGGGQVQLYGSNELRYDWAYGVSIATFVDAGWLSGDLSSMDVGDVRVGGGVGLRYDSPVGPIRIDIGIRPLHAEDAGPTDASSCSLDPYPPAVRTDRPYDILSSWQSLSDPADRIPVAINLYLAIGEAF